MEKVDQLPSINQAKERHPLGQQMLMQDGGTRPHVPKTFTLSDNQVDRIREWKEEQFRLKDPDLGTVSGRFVYEFFELSIGDGLTVRDLVTGNEKDFTDYDQLQLNKGGD